MIDLKLYMVVHVDEEGGRTVLGPDNSVVTKEGDNLFRIQRPDGSNTFVRLKSGERLEIHPPSTYEDEEHIPWPRPPGPF